MANWIIAENKLWDQQKFMNLTHFVHHDYHHKLMFLFWPNTIAQK